MVALGHQHSWTTTDMMMCSCGVMCGMHMIEDTVFLMRTNIWFVILMGLCIIIYER